MKKPAIPAISPNNTLSVLGALKENVESMTGRRGGELPLITDAEAAAMGYLPTDVVIVRINAIIRKLNASG